ncbi:hypothetical protein CSOJ01_13186 [Colletotrichum sojae]|uniref:Uncharacterized protein n=1 Tax=Colletotrichum sojae TaxID=2175907 RepID=A0A8H6MLG2_9PEZI|nr:hypothetical protein CSOJ01_13186 [Colletotrichum sojae]
MPVPGLSAGAAKGKCGIATYDDDDADALETNERFVGAAAINYQRSTVLDETSRVVMRVVCGAGLVNGVPAC